MAGEEYMSRSELRAVVQSAALFTKLRLMAQRADDDALRRAIAVLKAAAVARAGGAG